MARGQIAQAVVFGLFAVSVVVGQKDDDRLSAGAAGHERSLGDKALMEGKLNVALQHFEKAVKMNPKDHMNLYKRATAYMIDKKYNSAIKDLNAVLEIKPDYLQALDKRSKIHALEGKFAVAREDLEKVLKIKGTDQAVQDQIKNLHVAEQMQNAAKKLIEQKNWHGARDHLNRAIDVAADSVDLLLSRAECHKNLGDRENVLADTGKALKSNGGHMGALLMRGEAYYHMLEFDLAQRHFREGLRQDPEHKVFKDFYRKIKKMENVMKSANEELGLRKYVDALESYDMGLKVDPTHAIYMGKMHLGRCKSFLGLKKFDDAIRACGQSMDTPEQIHDKKDRIDTLLTRAEALKGVEDYEEAVRDCERALNLEKENGDTKRKLEQAKQELKKSKMKDYYKVLGVEKNADEKTIKKAYKRKALELHPDKVCGSNQCKSKEESDRANQKFHDVAEAYEVLNDPELKARYDRGEDPIDRKSVV